MFLVSNEDGTWRLVVDGSLVSEHIPAFKSPSIDEQLASNSSACSQTAFSSSPA
jgi:hypothetical protein